MSTADFSREQALSLQFKFNYLQFKQTVPSQRFRGSMATLLHSFDDGLAVDNCALDGTNRNNDEFRAPRSYKVSP
jgi:hypothetical protein